MARYTVHTIMRLPKTLHQLMIPYMEVASWIDSINKTD